MARWPSLFAAALLAAPTALPAQSAGMARVEVARVVEAAQTCRGAPLEFAAARDHAKAQGFGDLPPEVRARMPYTTFTRSDVRLILIPTTFIPGSCRVYAKVGEEARFADVVAQLTSAFGAPPISEEASGANWWLEDRTIHASLDSGTLEVKVIFQSVARAEMLAGPRPARPATIAAPAAPVEMSPTSPAAEIGAAASACMAALAGKGIDSGAMERSGWPLAETTGEARVHRRDGSNVRIVTTGMGGGQCIVDAYGERMDGFDSIRDAVRTALTARFGSKVKLGTASGAEGDFSRGQGFLAGKRIGVLSSERRLDGLSIRFTAMSLMSIR